MIISKCCKNGNENDLKKKKLSANIFLVGYALLHFGISIAYYIKPTLIEATKYFRLDHTNYIFLLMLSVVYLAVAIYNCGYTKSGKIIRYSCMTLVFVLAITGAILSNNLGLSWVFIEATTLASAYLICHNRTKHSIEAAWKYVFICSIGIALAFVGIILLTISSGSMNSLAFEDLYIHAKSFNPYWLKLGYVFILFGIGTKMGLAPVHFWLPDAHSEAPTPISALLSAGLLNSAFLIILKVYRIVVISGNTDFAQIMMITMGFISLFIAAVFLYYITNYKRMLAYSSIENMGILIIGAGLGGIAFYASILHMIAHSLIKASFFLTSGNILEIYGTKKIKSVSGIMQLDRKTGWLWVLSFLAIAAFPPSLLFISEFLMIKTMILQEHYILCSLFVILLTIILFGLAKSVINMSFSKPNENKITTYKENTKKLSLGMYSPQIIMLTIAFILGCYIPEGLDSIIKAAITGFGG
jgi:hydrogenase-4 component F